MKLEEYAEALAHFVHSGPERRQEVAHRFGIALELWHRVDAAWTAALADENDEAGRAQAIRFSRAFIRTRRELARQQQVGSEARAHGSREIGTVPPPAAPEVRIDAKGNGLTHRQRQVLSLLLGGASEKEIAARLGISQNTGHSHVKTIYRRFRVSSRAQLMAQWLTPIVVASNDH
jgi:DNA-binding CsgD family transcriptional regulator